MSKSYDKAQEWWEESQRILKENIEKTMEASPEKETLVTMLDLVGRMKIRNKLEAA